jgi:hypothetical protein
MTTRRFLVYLMPGNFCLFAGIVLCLLINLYFCPHIAIAGMIGLVGCVISRLLDSRFNPWNIDYERRRLATSTDSSESPDGNKRQTGPR